MRRPALLVLFVVAAGLVSASPSAVSQAAPADGFRWEGLARRNPGLVLFRSRWDAGVLELRNDLLRWADARDPGKNLVLPVRRLVKHEIVCPRPGAPCTEWRVATRTETYVFRARAAGADAELKSAFDALRAAYDVPSGETR